MTEATKTTEEGKLKVFKIADKVQIFDPRTPTTQEEYLQYANEAQVLIDYCVDNDVQYAEAVLS